jgi:hypothetical protein
VRAFFRLVFLLAVISLAVYFFAFKIVVDFNQPQYSKLIGTSNDGYLGDRVLIKKVDTQKLEIGHFVVREMEGEYVVHPIVRIIRIDGEVVGYVTKGIVNKYEDEILLPHQIVGRAFKVLEDGSVEVDTKYDKSLH